MGEGAAQGLNLPTKGTVSTIAIMRARRRAAAATGSTSGTVTAAVEGFTRSLSDSFLANINVTALTNQFTASMSSSSMMSVIAPALAAAGAGLGSGTAVGLGAQPKINIPSNQTFDIPMAIHGFTYELTNSFFTNGTLASLGSSFSSSNSSSLNLTFSGMLAPAAQGFGSGLGQGAAVGLGLQDANTVTTPTGDDLASVAHNFAFGLTNSFLENGTLSQLSSKASTLLGNSSSLSTSSIDVSKVAEGLARGLVNGAGDAVTNAGGIQALFDGTTNTTASALSTPIPFNDSVGGASNSFGYGLGSSSVSLILQLFGTTTNVSSPAVDSNATTADSIPAPDSIPAASDSNITVSRRGLATIESRIIRRSDARRATSTNLTSVITSLNVSQIDGVFQSGIDSLTCEGVGGMVQVLFGLYLSGTLSIPSNLTLTNLSATADSLPNATFTIKDSGNTFVVNPKELYVSVNGLGVIKFAVLLVLHGKSITHDENQIMIC